MNMTQHTTQKLGDICRIEKGRTGIASSAPGEYPLVVTAEERKTCNTYQFDCEAVCIPLVSSSGHGKKSLKNVHYQSGKFALGSILCAVIPKNPQEVNARYLHQYLQFYKDTLLVPLMKGAANVSLSMRDIANVEVPLPDFDTQAALAKIFVEAQEKQKRLNAEFEKQTEYAKRLRQNILQEAIEGKLTAEWRKTHPAIKGNPDFDAQALFEQIQKEKEGNAFPCGRTPSRPTPSAGSNAARNARLENDQPFEIPDSWKWVSLNAISTDILYGVNKPAKEFGKYKLLRITDIQNNKVEWDKVPYTNFDEKKVLPYLLKKGDVLFARTGGTVGKSYLVEDCPNNAIYASYLIKVQLSKNIDYKYIKYFFESHFYWSQVFDNVSGSGQPNCNGTKLSNLNLPLPPLAEQKEIVTKIESLLANVTELENQIQERKKMIAKLVYCVIKEKLER